MSQRRTVPSTNNGTSENASKKKEHWKTKAKRERDEQTTLPPKGNPDFLLTPDMEAEALADFNSLADQEEASNYKPSRDIPVVTHEDHEIDQMLERTAKTNPIQDLGVETPLVKEKVTRDTLRNYVANYKAAASLLELEEQVHMALSHEIDSIEAAPALVRHIFKNDYEHIKNVTGYAVYKNIRVYIDGVFEQNKGADSLTMEQKLHGKGSKGDTVPIIRPQKV